MTITDRIESARDAQQAGDPRDTESRSNSCFVSSAKAPLRPICSKHTRAWLATTFTRPCAMPPVASRWRSA